MTLVGSGDVAARRSLDRQTGLIEVIDHRLSDGNLARPKVGMPERVFHRPNVADVEPLADDHHGPASAPQKVVHLLAELFEGDGGLGHIDEQRHLTRGVGQPRGGGNEADFTSHCLENQNRVGRRGTFVLFVGVLNGLHPVTRGRTVTGGMVD